MLPVAFIITVPIKETKTRLDLMNQNGLIWDRKTSWVNNTKNTKESYSTMTALHNKYQYYNAEEPLASWEYTKDISSAMLYCRQNISCIRGGKKCSFFGQFGVLCFLVTPVSRFALLPYCRWFINTVANPKFLSSIFATNIYFRANWKCRFLYQKHII